MYAADEELPPSRWTRRSSTDDHIEYERREDADARRAAVRLHARRTPRAHPSGDGDTGWSLGLETLLREASSTRPIGAVSCRSEAVRSLFDAMRAINDIRSAGEGQESDAAVVERLRATTGGPEARGRRDPGRL